MPVYPNDQSFSGIMNDMIVLFLVIIFRR